MSFVDARRFSGARGRLLSCLVASECVYLAWSTAPEDAAPVRQLCRAGATRRTHITEPGQQQRRHAPLRAQEDGLPARGRRHEACGGALLAREAVVRAYRGNASGPFAGPLRPSVGLEPAASSLPWRWSFRERLKPAAASVLQASDVRGDVTVFRLNATAAG